VNYFKFVLFLAFLGFLAICWITVRKRVKDTKLSKKSGTFLAKDKFGTPVILEWERSTVKEPSHSKNMKEVCDVACKAYTEVEVRFLKEFPDVIKKEEYYAQFRPLFSKGIEYVDWKLIEKEMYKRIKQIHEMDYSNFSIDDIYFFIRVKDKETKELLGFTTFLIKPEFPQNTVKDISIGVTPEAQGRGLGKLLMSSIFKILPTVNRIFLFTRVTNDKAIGVYKAWGFTENLHPIQDPNFVFKKEHWVSLEYKIESADTLQKTAETLTKSTNG